MKGAAHRNGENAEPFFGDVRGLAASAEHMALDTLVEAESDAVVRTSCRNQQELCKRLVSMSTRASDCYRESSTKLHEKLVDVFDIIGKFPSKVDVDTWAAQFGLGQAASPILPKRAELCGLRDERDSLLGVASALDVAMVFNGRSAQEERKKVALRLQKLRSLIESLERNAGEGPSTTSEREEWRQHETYRVLREKFEAESVLKGLQQSFDRQGGNPHLHNYEKAVTRRKIEGQRKKIKLLVEQHTRLSVGSNSPSDFNGGLGEDRIPSILKNDIVNLLHISLRCLEELEFQLPSELSSFEARTRLDSQRLVSAAADLESLATVVSPNTRAFIGQATELRYLASVCAKRSAQAGSLRLCPAPQVFTATEALKLINASRAITAEGVGAHRFASSSSTFYVLLPALV